MLVALSHAHTLWVIILLDIKGIQLQQKFICNTNTVATQIHL